jgi:GDP/UDP-N,N'-diacetylbacillosamine 2-epimerase (hydrolysing)
MKKKVCVFTGSRAEYGLLKPLLMAIQRDKSFELQLIVSGTHLSPEFGLTCGEIEEDRFEIAEKVEMLLSSDTAVGICKSMGLGLIGYCEAMGRLNPDFVIVLGDRFETFAFTVSSFVQKKVILHIHGGERTEGALDDSFRHSITKMSYLHFASTDEYRKRVIQLGESPDRVFNVGALGVENVMSGTLLSKKTLERELGFRFQKRNLLITVHPETIEYAPVEKLCRTLLGALDELTDTQLIITKPNADEGGRIINRMVDGFVGRNRGRAVTFVSLGQLKYLSLMKYVDAVVGNSSSGIIEAPSFKIGTIDIGDRQKGRVKAESIISCKANVQSIRAAISELYSDQFKKRLKQVANPYGNGKTSEKIIRILKGYDFRQGNILKKGFYDIPINHE